MIVENATHHEANATSNKKDVVYDNEKTKPQNTMIRWLPSILDFSAVLSRYFTDLCKKTNRAILSRI